MTIFELLLKADLENVAEIRPKHSDAQRYCIRVKCANCDDLNEKWVYIDSSEEEEVVRNSANLVAKCKLCSRVNTINILTQSSKPLTTSATWEPVVELDCRGLVPVEFEMRDGFVVETTSGAVFDLVLDGEEFCEYDEKLGESVSVFGLEGKFEASKKKK